MTPFTADLFPRRGRHPNRKTSEYSAGRMWIELPALLARFCGGAGVGSGAWVPA